MTSLNYTSTAGDPALDEAFEGALATARQGRPAPLAQPGWAATPLAERIAALRRIARLIGERTVEMGAVVAAETGKVRLEAVPEVQEGVDLIEAYCGHMERNDGYRIPLGQLSPDEHNTSVMLP